MKNEQKITSHSVVHNSKVKDNGARLIFQDPILCAEFPMWQEERDSDSVKKIHLKDFSLYLIAIVEHQSKVHYDMSFRLLRYITMVLTDYAEEQEKLHKGITKTKDII